MRKFLIIIHNDDRECIVTAKNEDGAIEKYWNDKIDEWLTDEFQQADVTAKLYQD